MQGCSRQFQFLTTTTGVFGENAPFLTEASAAVSILESRLYLDTTMGIHPLANVLRRPLLGLFLSVLLTGCLPIYVEVTGGVHSVSGDHLEEGVAPSVGLGVGLMFDFMRVVLAAGGGADAVPVNTSSGDAVLWNGGVVLRGDLHLTYTRFDDVGFLRYFVTAGYTGPGWISLDGEDIDGSAQSVFLGGSLGWLGGTATLDATLAPHYLWAHHPQFGNMHAIGGQLRLRLGFHTGHFGSWDTIEEY